MLHTFCCLNRMRFLQVKLQPLARALSLSYFFSSLQCIEHFIFAIFRGSCSLSLSLVCCCCCCRCSFFVAFVMNLLHTFRYQLVCVHDGTFACISIVIFCFVLFLRCMPVELFGSQFCPVPFCRTYCTPKCMAEQKNILS